MLTADCIWVSYMNMMKLSLGAEIYLQQLNDWIDGFFARQLEQLQLTGLAAEQLIEAMKYSVVDQEAKRLRPLVVSALFRLLCSEDGGGSGGEVGENIVMAATTTAAVTNVNAAAAAAVIIGAAVEFVHSYSLVHDDLPCMDDDLYRRNKLSCHACYGEDVAVLVGDALLTMAFEALTELTKVDGVEVVAVVRIIKMLAQHAGNRGLVGGQFADIKPTAATPATIRRAKTGSLFAFCAGAAAVLAGRSDEVSRAATAFGSELGVLFQLYDDVLDAIQDAASGGSGESEESSGDGGGSGDKLKEFGIQLMVAETKLATMLHLAGIGSTVEQPSELPEGLGDLGELFCFLQRQVAKL